MRVDFNPQNIDWTANNTTQVREARQTLFNFGPVTVGMVVPNGEEEKPSLKELLEQGKVDIITDEVFTPEKPIVTVGTVALPDDEPYNPYTPFGPISVGTVVPSDEIPEVIPFGPNNPFGPVSVGTVYIPDDEPYNPFGPISVVPSDEIPEVIPFGPNNPFGPVSVGTVYIPDDEPKSAFDKMQEQRKAFMAENKDFTPFV